MSPRLLVTRGSGGADFEALRSSDGRDEATKEFLMFVAEDSLTPTRERIGGGGIPWIPAAHTLHNSHMTTLIQRFPHFARQRSGRVRLLKEDDAWSQ
jgi:hypothetical protein